MDIDRKQNLSVCLYVLCFEPGTQRRLNHFASGDNFKQFGCDVSESSQEQKAAGTLAESERIGKMIKK